MYPQMREALINWDYLETLLFPEFERLGIDLTKYPYYMAWAKRKAESGLRFSSVTQAQEWLILQDEFEARGLDPAFLVELEPTVEKWVHIIKGEAWTETLPVSEYVEEVCVNWVKVGAPPYLDKNDGTSNYVYYDAGFIGDIIQHFKFDSSAGVSLTKVELGVVVAGWNFTLGCDLWDGTEWKELYHIQIGAWISWTEFIFDVTATLNTIAKVNGAKLRLRTEYAAGGINVTYAFLRVYH